MNSSVKFVLRSFEYLIHVILISRYQVLWAFGNIAGENEDCRSKVIVPEIISAMCSCVELAKLSSDLEARYVLGMLNSVSKTYLFLFVSQGATRLGSCQTFAATDTLDYLFH